MYGEERVVSEGLFPAEAAGDSLTGGITVGQSENGTMTDSTPK